MVQDFEEIIRAKIAMVGNRMSLGEVITLVTFATAPINIEMALFRAITNPEETHVHSFGTFLLENIVDEASSSTIVRLDRSSGLGMS